MNVDIVTEVIGTLSARGSIINPASSCEEIASASQPGEFWIIDNDSQMPTRVYCDTRKSCGNNTREWTRVAYIDMTDISQQCPDGFNLITRTEAPLRTCGGRAGCVSITFPVNGIEYGHVYGQIKAYQFATTDAFLAYYRNRAVTIDDNYVDGVSLTYGQSPRKHIWTFAAAHAEELAQNYVCPCTRTDVPYTGLVPPFIGQDYFCETGGERHSQLLFYADDPLWDGQGCGGTSTCCSFNNPPYFCKQLQQPTTDDIELRLCVDEHPGNEDVPIELVEIYIQ